MLNSQAPPIWFNLPLSADPMVFNRPTFETSGLGYSWVFFQCSVLPQDWMLLFFYKCKFYHYRSIFRFQNQRNHETNSIFCMKLSTKIKFIVSPPLNPKSSQNPKYHIWLESLYNFWKNVHLRILNLVLKLVISPLKNILQQFFSGAIYRSLGTKFKILRCTFFQK